MLIDALMMIQLSDGRQQKRSEEGEDRNEVRCGLEGRRMSLGWGGVRGHLRGLAPEDRTAYEKSMLFETEKANKDVITMAH